MCRRRKLKTCAKDRRGAATELDAVRGLTYTSA